LMGDSEQEPGLGQMLIATADVGGSADGVDFQDDAKSSPLIDLGMLGGLGHFISLVKARLSDASKTLELEREAAPEAEWAQLEKRAVTRRQLYTWLSAMEGSLELPGFVDRFIADQTSAALLLHALGAGNLESFAAVPTIEAVLQDPTGSQLTHNLTELLAVGGDHAKGGRTNESDSAAAAVATELRNKCLEKGTLDIILLHLGKLHGMSSANFDWTDQFEDPAVVRERKAKEKEHAEKEKAKAAIIAAKEKKSSKSKSGQASSGSGGDEPFVIPAQGFSGDSSSSSSSGGGGNTLLSKKANEGSGGANKPPKKVVDASTKGTFNCLSAFLDVNGHGAAVAEGVNMGHLRRALEASPLVKVLQSVMMATETDDVLERPQWYVAIVRLLSMMSKHAAIVGLVDVGAGPTSPYEQLKKLRFKVDALVQMEEGAEAKDAGSKAATKKKTSKLLHEMKSHIVEATVAVDAWRLSSPPERADSGGSAADGSDGYETLYAVRMAKHHFAYRSILGDASHVFKYKSEIASSKDAKPERQKALLRELTGNLLELPIHFNTSTLVRVDEVTQHAMQFLVLAGQEGGGSPYDGGCFLFDLYVPPTYPRTPPKVTLATTGGGTVRFNPNLYLDGYVCLTVLNAKGSGGETWRAGDSNLFEVIMAIQSFVLNKMYPLFNEPAEGSKFRGADTDAETKRRARTAHWSGSQFGETGYQAVREGTLEHAMIGQLRNPSAGFEDAIREHFLLKGTYIVRQVEGWIADADRFPDDAATHKKKLESLLVEFKDELKKLTSEGKYTDGTAVGDAPAVVKDATYKYQQYPF